jgi:hypothetical protein
MRTSKEWDNELKKIQAILNEKKSEATGLTPNELLFAGKINLHEGRLFPQPTEKQRINMSKFMKDQIEIQDKLIKIAEEKQQRTNEKHLANNKDKEIKHYIGDYIVVKHESGIAPHKLSIRWHGPYRITDITKRQQGAIYTCYSPKDGKVADYHASIVKEHPCESDQEAVRSSILDDDDTFIVEEIIGHEIIKSQDIRNKNKKLNLHVKWHGYKQPEWTAINASLKRNIVVKDYLKQHKLNQWIENKEVEEQPKVKKVRFSTRIDI